MKKHEIDIVATYHVGYSNSIELPEGKNPSDIDDIWIKWDKGTITFKDESTLDFIFEKYPEYNDDLKKPTDIDAYNETGENVYCSYE